MNLRKVANAYEYVHVVTVRTSSTSKCLENTQKKSLFLKTNDTKYLYFRRKVYVVNVMNVVQSNDYIPLMSSSYEMSYRVCLSKQLFYLIRNFMHMNFSEHTLSVQLETTQCRFTPAVDFCWFIYCSTALATFQFQNHWLLSELFQIDKRLILFIIVYEFSVHLHRFFPLINVNNNNICKVFLSLFIFRFFRSRLSCELCMCNNKNNRL